MTKQMDKGPAGMFMGDTQSQMPPSSLRTETVGGSDDEIEQISEAIQSAAD